MEGVRRSAVLSGDSIRTRLLAAFFFAAVTATCAQISFRLWHTPVPVTLQVFGVILSGLVLGSRWGAISQLQYLAAGAMGLPVFANWMGGPAAFVGPSGGYLVGFVLGAFAAGWIFEQLGGRTSLAALVGGIAGIAAIYLPGALWLAVWMGTASGQPTEACVRGAWQLGIVPFIAVDLLKAALASAVALGGRSGRGLINSFRNHPW